MATRLSLGMSDHRGAPVEAAERASEQESGMGPQRIGLLLF